MSKGASSSSEDAVAGIIGLLFWVLIIAVGLYLYFKEDHVDVYLDVSAQSGQISGTVSFEGVPIGAGALHVVVADAKSKRYIAGATLPVEKGQFRDQALLDSSRLCEPLHIVASFRGSLPKADNKTSALSGEATVYLNWLSPLGERFLWSIATGLVALLVLLLFLFTGSMGRSKARALFILMYFFTFMSLAVPIVFSLVVSQNPYMVDAMEKSPIGLVQAKTKGQSEPQWLVNIGGTVSTESAAAAAPKPPASPSEALKTEAAKPEPVAAPAEPAATQRSGKTACVAAPPTPVNRIVIVGGLAVPFYVVLLAMFGAGVNMTLKVPEIQRTSDINELPRERINPAVLLGSFFVSRDYAPTATQRRIAADIRRELIENFMYLLSAPFLAIAMYYMLQLLAQQVTEPVLVLMAFATGLVSKAVVGGIIDFAENRLRSVKSAYEKDSPSAQAQGAVTAAAEARTRAADEVDTKQAEADAAAGVAADAVKAQAEAEAAAKAAETEREAKIKTAEQAQQTAKVADAEKAAAAAKADKTPGDAVLKTAAEAAAKTAEEAGKALAAASKEAKDAAGNAADLRDKAAKAADEAREKQKTAQQAVKAVDDARARLAKAQEAETAAKTAAEEAKKLQAQAEAAVQTAKAQQVQAEEAAQPGKADNQK